MLSPDFKQKYGPWAVIAGGSDGIGAAFAEQLAAAGIHIALLARREEVLRECAAGLRARHGVHTHTVSVDLAAPDMGERIAAATAELELGLLIYNAGASTHAKRFLDQPLADSEYMVALNCTGPIKLAHHFGGLMRPRRRGGMIFLSSMAGLAGCAYEVAYSAGKAFDKIFAEALWADLQADGIDALGLIVGATFTPSHERADVNFAVLNPDNPAKAAMQPAAVASEGLAHLGRTPVWVAGAGNRASFPFMNGADRSAAINAMSQGTAMIHGLEHSAATALEPLLADAPPTTPPDWSG